MRAMPQPRRAPSRMLPSYLENRFRLLGLLGFAADSFSLLASIIAILKPLVSWLFGGF